MVSKKEFLSHIKQNKNERENDQMGDKEVLKLISTIDALIDTVAKEIVDGEWKEGVQLKDTAMAEKYGVSRNSIREAFSVLVEQGFLEKRKNRGVFIPEFTSSDIIELYNARLVIELEAIENLTKKKEVPQEMYEALDRVKDKNADYMRSYLVEEDFAFHMALIGSLNNTRLNSIANNLLTKIKIINRRPHLAFSLDFIMNEHEKIIDAILSGDVALSRNYMREHITHSIDRQISEMEETKQG